MAKTGRRSGTRLGRFASEFPRRIILIFPLRLMERSVRVAEGCRLRQRGADLPRHRIPVRLKALLPSASGSNQDACWAMGEGPFEPSPVATGLSLRLESGIHGLVEPENNQPISEYRGNLAATRDQWVIER